MSTKKKVCYYYDPDIGNFYYGQGHPMKPHRIRVAHHMIVAYDMYRKMEVLRPAPANAEEMTKFHSDEYVKFMRTVTPDNFMEPRFAGQLKKFNVGEDCPVFDGLYQFCQLSGGGSVGGAIKLNHKQADIAINWAGGLHHAKKSEASGFCYCNDIVLAILELLKYHPRVLYIDIDIHHGDGVEEAFYTTNRVMSVSFHKYGEYFPGTGDARDVGYGEGKGYAVNFPLHDGVSDKAFVGIFRTVLGKVMEKYDPAAIVLQCGADSLSGDRLGCFNLSLEGHADCVEFMKSFNKPLLIVGGGGYTMRNVARCWTAETAVALNVELDPHLPYTDYYEYFGPDYGLPITPSNMEDLNTPDYLQKIQTILLQTLDQVEAKPSVAFQDRQSDAPSTYTAGGAAEGAEPDPDARQTLAERDSRVSRNEFSDSDDDDDGAGYGGAITRKSRQGAGRRNKTDFRSAAGDNGMLFLDHDAGTSSYSISRRGGAAL